MIGEAEMPKQSVIIDLPDDVYNKYKQRAEQMQRPIEAEIVEVVSKAAFPDDELPAELEELVTQLAFLNDKALQRVASSKLTKKEAARIETLHYKRQSEGLNNLEIEELAALMRKFNRWFVLRNAALGLLIERSQNVTESAPKE